MGANPVGRAAPQRGPLSELPDVMAELLVEHFGARLGSCRG